MKSGFGGLKFHEISFQLEISYMYTTAFRFTLTFTFTSYSQRLMTA